MADVWIVTYGDYSAYRIVGAFSSAEAAHETAKRLSCGEEPSTIDRREGVTGYGEYQVERYSLDEVAWEARYKAIVSVTKGVLDGRFGGVQVFSLSAGEGDDMAKRGVEVWWWAAYDYSPPPGAALDEYGLPRTPSARITAYAEEPERARKVAAERAYQVAAEWDLQVEAARSRGELA